MPTKTQAKTAIDNAAATTKTDIDNILPVGVNIIDGSIGFAPTRWTIRMDAGLSAVTADSWLASIVTALTGAGRTSTVTRSGRRVGDPPNSITIKTTLANYQIINF